MVADVWTSARRLWRRGELCREEADPTDETFATGIATLGSFGVRRLTFDVNAPLSDSKYLLFRITGSTQTVGSFVDFVHRRGFDIAPALDV
ncbi:MAG: hypothetical protein C3F11_10350 [Methylocystaceae bacterium]|nr:MAG: hypothetical protein C3F11_10350 [Methylocystaceae bacterium]